MINDPVGQIPDPTFKKKSGSGFVRQGENPLSATLVKMRRWIIIEKLPSLSKFTFCQPIDLHES